MPTPVPRPLAAGAHGALSALWLLMLMAVGAAFALYMLMPAATSTGGAQEDSQRIVMETVHVQGFDSKMRPSMDLWGKKAITFKNSQDVIFQPIEGILRQDLDKPRAGSDLHVKADHGLKTIVARQMQLDFKGSVEVVTGDQRLRTQQLLYSPESHVLETTVPVEIITTSTIVQADRMTSHTDLKTGSFEGEVTITTIGEAPGKAGAHDRKKHSKAEPPRSILILEGDRTTFDLTREVYDVTGLARGRWGDVHIQAARMTYNHYRDEMVAFSSPGRLVKVDKPQVSLTCGHLVYSLAAEHAVATSSPVAVQETHAPHEGATRQTIRAQVLTSDFKGQLVTGEGGVRVTRAVEFEDEWEDDYDIRSKSVLANMATRKTSFRDDVAITSNKLGALGEKAILYQTSGKLYIIGSAQAWDIGSRGERKNLVRGNIIVHNVKTGENKVLDKVQWDIKEEGSH